MTMPVEAAGLVGGAKDKGFSLDKLPLLGDLFDQFATACAESVRESCSASLQLRPQGMAADREDAIFKTFDANILAFTIYDADWGCRFAIVLERDFVFTLIEAMLGSEGNDAPYKEVRPLSTIERGVATSFAEIAAEALNRVISPMSMADFQIEKVDTRLGSVVLGGRGEAAVLARLGVEALGCTGEMSLILPRVAIERLRPHLAKTPAALESKLIDPKWTRQFEDRVTRAEVAVCASIDVHGFSLRDIVALVPGQIITLGDQAQRQVALASEEEPLFTCELGQSDGFYSIRITAEYDHDAIFGQASMELAGF
jgi:flagellar motor switch protein FliM